MFGKLLTNQKIAHKIVKSYVYKALREGLKTHDNGKIQNLRGFDSLSLRDCLRASAGLACSVFGLILGPPTLGATFYISIAGLANSLHSVSTDCFD